jgi:hypothetical protein
MTWGCIRVESSFLFSGVKLERLSLIFSSYKFDFIFESCSNIFCLLWEANAAYWEVWKEPSLEKNIRWYKFAALSTKYLNYIFKK